MTSRALGPARRSSRRARACGRPSLRDPGTPFGGYLLDGLDPLATGEENPGEMPVWEGLICDACGDHVIDLEEAVIWQEDRSMICPEAALAPSSAPAGR